MYVVNCNPPPFFEVLGVEPGASLMLDKHSTTQFIPLAPTYSSNNLDYTLQRHYFQIQLTRI